MKIKKFRIKRILVYVITTAAAIVSFFPFYWIMCGSTNKSVDIIKGKLSFGTYLWVNFQKLVEVYEIGRIVLNTAFVAVCACLLSLLICALAAYAFAKYEFIGKNLVYGILMVSMMIPFSATMVPMFRMAAKLHLMNTLIRVILPSVAPMFLLFFFRQSFSSFPTEIIEAARIDGSGEFRIIRSIVLPSTKSVFAAGLIWSFMTNWNNYLWPLLIIQIDDKKVISLLLSNMSSSFRNIDYGAMMVAIVIATAPIVIIYFTMQKQFVEGIVGATKG